MNPDTWILAAIAVAVALLLIVLMCTAPGGGLTPGMVVALWAYAPPLYRRHRGRHYHRHGSPGVHHHIQPGRRAIAAPIEREPVRALPPGRQFRELLAATVTATSAADTAPWETTPRDLDTQPIRQFARIA